MVFKNGPSDHDTWSIWCNVGIHVEFTSILHSPTYSIGPSSGVCSKVGPPLPFPPTRCLKYIGHGLSVSCVKWPLPKPHNKLRMSTNGFSLQSSTSLPLIGLSLNLVIFHPHILVQATIERFLPAWTTFSPGSACESHLLQTMLVLTVHLWPAPICVGGLWGVERWRLTTYCLKLNHHYNWKGNTPPLGNVRGESVFSVIAAGWFCEKSG